LAAVQAQPDHAWPRRRNPNTDHGTAAISTGFPEALALAALGREQVLSMYGSAEKPPGQRRYLQADL